MPFPVFLLSALTSLKSVVIVFCMLLSKAQACQFKSKSQYFINAFQSESTSILLQKCSITSLNDQNVYRLETFLPMTTKQSCLALSLILFGSVLAGSSKIFKKFSMNIFNTDVHVSCPFTFANFRNAGTERNRFKRSCNEYS